jgi:hypothetical protein
MLLMFKRRRRASTFRLRRGHAFSFSVQAKNADRRKRERGWSGFQNGGK